VTKKINSDLSEKEAVYDDQNNIATIYDELDHYIMKYYDGLARLTKTEWYLSPTEKLTEIYTYNYQNNLKMRTDPGGHIYSYEYDSKGRKTKMLNPDSTFKQIQYNDITNTVTFYDENIHKKEYRYDWMGNLLRVKEYTDSQNYYLTQYTYDSVGNLTSLTDANGNTTLYDYNSLFGVTQITYPDFTTEIFSYDNVGNVSQKTDANGTTTFTYSAIYQLTGIQYPDQSLISLEYDANGSRTLMADPAGSISYTYDNRNRLLSKIRTMEGESYAVGYVYDAASRIVSITYPDQSTITYEYDSVSRLVSIPGYATFTYNVDSLPVAVYFNNDITTTYQYDNRDRPLEIQAQRNGTDLLIMTYQHNPVGNIIQMEYNRRCSDQQWIESVENFQYDWLDRLVSAQGDYSVLSYSYDPVGNRLSLNDLNYVYSNMNELLSITDGTTFTYDEMGNTLTKTDGTDTRSYTYDTRNQLIQVDKNQHIIAEYQYDGDGRRIQKTEWKESLEEYHTTIYIYSGLEVIYEKNLSTNKEATYVYGAAGRIAKKVSELTDYYHTDHLGSTRLITDEQGNVVTDSTYTSFGESTVSGEDEPYLYTGKEIDSTGLYYYGARYYDPETGRFISKDPGFGRLGNPQTLNRYVYVLNNPLKYIDPDGRENVGYLYDLDKNDRPNHWPETLARIKSWWNSLPWYAKVGLAIAVVGLLLLCPPLVGLLAPLVGLETGTLAYVLGTILSSIGIFLMVYGSTQTRLCKIEEKWMNPFGERELISVHTEYWPGSDVPHVKIYIREEDDKQVGYEYYDENGNLIAGWKWENGVYYVWVPKDSNNPSEGGEWEESDPPPS